jgi:putative ABC transport system ATP-binding protein
MQLSASTLAVATIAAVALIELHDVTKTYKTGDEVLKALDNVNLTIEAGRFVAVLGPSGSGKSTLADVIGGLDTPDFGQVVVAGKDLARMRDRALSRYRNEQVGFIFQNFNLQYSYTVLENVMLPLVLGGAKSRDRKARAEECLKLVGLEDRMHHRASKLSGGQAQRVAIARALVTKPSIIIADEPTGNLDSSRGADVIALLIQLNKSQGITLIVVTHDMAVAWMAHSVLNMKDGQVAESQSVTESQRLAQRLG